MGLEKLVSAGERRLAARFEVQEPPAVGLDDEGRPRRFALQEGNARVGRFCERALAGAEAERQDRFEELAQRVRSRETLQEQRRVERDAAELAKAADQPREVLPCQLLVQTPAPSGILTQPRKELLSPGRILAGCAGETYRQKPRVSLSAETPR